MKAKIFCLVLNYRHFLDTEKCIKALSRSDGPKGTIYIIIDNSPDNLSVKYFKKNLSRIKVIKNAGNFGFAKGNNVGIRYAQKQGATHILIINPDVVVGKRFFKPLLRGLGKDIKAGMAAPAIRHEQNGVTFFGLAGKVDWRTGKASHQNLRRLPRNKKVTRAEFVTFACVLVKTDVFRKVGLLDECYFMYLEDVDYCLQVKKAGFHILLNQDVVVDHTTSSSFERPMDKLPISFRSQVKFVNKWWEFPSNVAPILHALMLYPYLYFLWTYHYYKQRF